MTKIKLSVKRLTTGLYIQLPCGWSEHPFLFSCFKIQDETQIKAIQLINIKYVFLLPDKSDNAPLPVSSDSDGELPNLTIDKNEIQVLWSEKEKKIEEQKIYIRTFKKCESQYNQSLSFIRSINLKVSNQPQHAVNDAYDLVTTLVNSIIGINDTILHLMEEGKEEDKYFNHVLNTTILSILLGKAMNLSEQDLLYLGLAALFHDLGKNKIPTQILRNNPCISKVEQNYLNMHVRYGIEQISHFPNFPYLSIQIIEQHHEYLDGSGYPEKLKGEQINQLTQIFSVANEYDNMCNPTDKHKKSTPHHALSHLYKHRDKQLNKNVVGLLIKELGIYPPGCTVQLSNEQYALVISVMKSNLLQPKVLIYDASIPRHEAPIIALNNRGLSIIRVLSPSNLPDSVREYLNLRSRIHYFYELSD